MSQPVRLSIPKPCHEKWNDFTPTATGGFCSSCSKNVIDFTKMTDGEIIDFIKTKPENTCGRFRQSQLKDYTIQRTYDLKIKPSGMLLRAGLVSLVVAFISKPAAAQQQAMEWAKVEQSDSKKQGSSTDKHTISGIVVDNDSIPMPGVNVVLAGTVIGTTTDREGKFTFPAQVDDGQTLIFSFIGYNTYTHYVGFMKDNFLRVQMKLQPVRLGEVRFVTMGEVMIQKESKENKGNKGGLWATIKDWLK